MTDEELSISGVTLIARLRMVTGFIRFETGDRVTASICLSEEAANRIEQLVATNEQLESSMREIVALNSPEKAWEATLAKNIALAALKGN